MTKEKKQILKAEFGSDETRIKFGSINIPCYVLEDGQRVLSGKGMQDSLGFSKNSSGMALTKFLSREKIAEIIPQEVRDKIRNRIEFTRKGAGGAISKTYGYDATILVDLCDILIQARKDGRLTTAQNILVEQAEIIMRSVAKVGIIALIDEATGYQNIRKEDALQKILDAFISKELAAWVKRFPDEFYNEMFRLKGWKWNSKLRPAVVGRYTNDAVYERLAPNLVEELKKKTPKNENGMNKNRFHQWLTTDVGHPALSQHLYAVIGLMRTCQSWGQFMRLLNRAFPKKNEQMFLDLGDD